MKLSENQIKAITFGQVCSETTDEGMKFFKCTPKQISAWNELSKTLGDRARTSTGISLDFHTDSKTFSFEAIGKFEVYLNDLYHGKFNLTAESPRADVNARDPQDPDRHEVRITLIFPSHDEGILRSVELDDGAYVKPHTFDTKLLFIGDSITQGWDSGYDSLSYAWRVTRFFNAERVIHGVGGGYFHPTTFDSIDFDPDTVIIALGTNDFGKFPTLDELREKVSGFMELIAKEYAGKKIFCISPIWRAVQEKPMGSFTECRGVIIEEAAKHGMIHIDGLELVPHDPIFFADQTLHPNALGFGIYAENLIRKLQKYM